MFRARLLGALVNDAEKKAGTTAQSHPPSTDRTTRRMFLRRCIGTMAAVSWVNRAMVQAANVAPGASVSTKDDGYRGIWFTLGQKSEYGDKYSGRLGTYTANHVPMAIYAKEAEKTFFVYGGAKQGQRHLLAMASYYDHRHHVVPRPTIVHDKQGVNDPHDNPSLGMDGHGHLWVFVSGRARQRPGLIYRSVKPYSTDDFEPVGEREFTYPQPRWFEGEGFFFSFTKYTKGRELYFSTSPDGRHWAPDKKLAGIGGHYQTSHQAGHRIITAFNMHPGGDVDKRTNLYFLQTEDLGKTWRKQCDVTRGSAMNHNYVRRPINAHPDFYPFWADGDPDKFTKSSLYFANATGDKVWRLPYDMTGDSAEPALLK